MNMSRIIIVLLFFPLVAIAEPISWDEHLAYCFKNLFSSPNHGMLAPDIVAMDFENNLHVLDDYRSEYIFAFFLCFIVHPVFKSFPN